MPVISIIFDTLAPDLYKLYDCLLLWFLHFGTFLSPEFNSSFLSSLIPALHPSRIRLRLYSASDADIYMLNQPTAEDVSRLSWSETSLIRSISSLALDAIGIIQCIYLRREVLLSRNHPGISYFLSHTLNYI